MTDRIVFRKPAWVALVFVLFVGVLPAEEWPRLTPEEWTNMTTERLRDIVDAGVPVHTSGEMGPNALMLAAARSNGAVVEILLEHGARVDAQDMGARAAIHYAAGNPDPTVMNALLAAGARPYEEILASAARTNTSVEVIQALIDAGVLFENGFGLDRPGTEGCAVLFASIRNDNPAVMLQILELGVSFNDEHREHALQAAITWDAGIPVVESILQMDVDVDRPAEQPEHRRGYTALMHLLRRRNHIDHGADINLTDSSGRTARWYIQDNEPHIHARYSGQEAVFRISDGSVLAGELPVKQTRLVQAWIELRRDELSADWELAITGENPYKIEPL